MTHRHRPVHLMVRGFKSGKVLWSESLTFGILELERLLPALATEHAHAMIDGTLGMIEIEFLDEPDPQERYFRIGVETDNMVAPREIDLKGSKP